MNKHIESMKTTLNGYYKALKATDEKIRHNNETYQREVAAAENRRLQAEIEQQRIQTEREIRAAIAAGQEDINAWMTPDGNQITNDARLLQHGIGIEDFRKLAARYRDNYSMSELLQRYADTENEKIRNAAAKEGHLPSEFYPDWEIRSGENRKKAYERMGAAALDLIRAMHDRPGFGTGLESETLQHAVETFGEANNPNAAAVIEML